MAKRHDGEKQADSARLAVSLSWDRSRVIGPNVRGPLSSPPLGHEVPLDRLRRGLARFAAKTVCGSLRFSSSILLLAPRPHPSPVLLIPFLLLRHRAAVRKFFRDFDISSGLPSGRLHRPRCSVYRTSARFTGKIERDSTGCERRRVGTSPFQGSIEESSSHAHVSAPFPFFFSPSVPVSLPLHRFVLVIIEESVRGRALWSASIVPSGRQPPARCWLSRLEQVLRNSRLMRRPGVQVKRIMAFNEEESCGSRAVAGP